MGFKRPSKPIVKTPLSVKDAALPLELWLERTKAKSIPIKFIKVYEAILPSRHKYWPLFPTTETSRDNFEKTNDLDAQANQRANIEYFVIKEKTQRAHWVFKKENCLKNTITLEQKSPKAKGLIIKNRPLRANT